MHSVYWITNKDNMTRDERGTYGAFSNADLKSAREERFVSHFWEALRGSENSVYDLDCKYTDVLPSKIPA